MMGSIRKWNERAGGDANDQQYENEEKERQKVGKEDAMCQYWRMGGSRGDGCPETSKNGSSVIGSDEPKLCSQEDVLKGRREEERGVCECDNDVHAQTI